MKTELEKQIEIAETVVRSGGCHGLHCDGCPLVNGSCFNGKDVKKAKAFLAKHKPVITKEELIERCRGRKVKYTKDVLLKLKDVGFTWPHKEITGNEDHDAYSLNINKPDSYCDHPHITFSACSYDMKESTFLNLFTPSVTIAKNSTAIDNPSVNGFNGVEVKEYTIKDNVKVTIEMPEPKKKLTKREMILKNKKEVVEVCENALVCYDSKLTTRPLAAFENGEYRYYNTPHSIEQLGRVSDWYRNLEKKVGEG